MSKIESIIVGLFLGITCPLLTFVTFWWSAALLHMHVAGFPVRVVIASAFAGLAVGLILDVLFLRSWVRRIYRANLWLMGVCYLGLCTVAVAFFMGLPVGTLTLGVVAGVYMGRRESYARDDWSRAAPVLRKTALTVAAVTTVGALPIGILALSQRDVLRILERLSGFDPARLQEWPGFVLIGGLCALLFVLQCWFSKKAGLIAYGIGGKSAQPPAAAGG